MDKTAGGAAFPPRPKKNPFQAYKEAEEAKKKVCSAAPCGQGTRAHAAPPCAALGRRSSASVRGVRHLL